MRAFWEIPLNEVTPDEWEALCDGCAKCCFVHDGMERTEKPCRLLDTETNLCTNYRKRFSELKLDDGYRCRLAKLALRVPGELPDSCAYVRRSKDQGLEQWQIDKARQNYGGLNEPNNRTDP